MSISELVISIANKIKGIKENVLAAYDAVASKNGDVPEVEERTMSNLPNAIESIPAGEEVHYYKEVTFIDHLGIVADYTIEEALALNEMPSPKEYTNLTFDGWSMSLEEIQDGQPHTIAANYHTTDNTYRFGYTTRNGKLLHISIRGEITKIDFGDGLQTDVITSDIYHTYESDGEYDVIIHGNVTQVTFAKLELRTGVTYIEMPNTISTYDTMSGVSNGSVYNAPYLKYIVFPKMEMQLRLFLPSSPIVKFLALPNNINSIIYIKAAHSLECINIPKAVSSFSNNYPFYLLRKIVFEGNCKTISIGGNNIFTLINLYVNNGVQSIGVMENCNLDSLVIPESLTTIPSKFLMNAHFNDLFIQGTPVFVGNNTFRETKGSRRIHFESPIPPQLESYIVFYNFKGSVFIPQGSIDTYRDDTNWSAAEAAGYFTFIEE
jgi:hypothetical protein